MGPWECWRVESGTDESERSGRVREEGERMAGCMGGEGGGGGGKEERYKGTAAHHSRINPQHLGNHFFHLATCLDSISDESLRSPSASGTVTNRSHGYLGPRLFKGNPRKSGCGGMRIYRYGNNRGILNSLAPPSLFCLPRRCRSYLAVAPVSNRFEPSLMALVGQMEASRPPI